MEKYRVVIYDSSNENLDGVTVFRMKPGATDTSDVNSWLMVDVYENLPSVFRKPQPFKPSDFRIVGDQSNPITLQNFSDKSN